MGIQCPICGKATHEKTKPFCSSRCAMLDLGQWLGEGYRVPVDENSDESGDFKLSDTGDDEGL